MNVDELRQWIQQEVDAVREHVELASSTGDKESLRDAHGRQRSEVLERSRKFLQDKEDYVLPHLADGSDVDPLAIDPVLVPVITESDVALYKYATLSWSVPVSQGYGRRTRFLVTDKSNGKLIGVFSLGDPVIAQSVRDNEVGWNKEQRLARLFNVLDAFVLGAVEPYRQLLGGKLMALMTISNETRNYIREKYAGRTTVISGVRKDPRLALVTTSSALGRSSVYNRVTYQGRTMFNSVGYSRGFGHFQFPEPLFRAMVEFHRQNVDPAEAQGNKYANGANWKFRVIRTVMKDLGLDPDLLNHKIRREVFLAPTASNWGEFLRGETNELCEFDLPTESIGNYYRERWASGRALRKPEFEAWQKSEHRLSSLLKKAEA